MTTIYFDLNESHRFSSIEAEPCPGLESLTGADFLVSDLPIEPVENIQWHLDNRSIPVNLKVGYDALNNSDQRHKFAARVQALGFKVAFLLGVGSYRNKDGFLQVSGYRTNEKVVYRAFQQMKLNEVARGVTWDAIETLEELPSWIHSASKMMELPPKNIIFSKSQYPLHEWYDDKGSDPWQSMEEVSPESVQHILACGLPGFGPKRANAVIEYLEQNKIPICLYTALAIVSQIDEKGKRVHKIKGIGTEYWKRIRDYLYRCQGPASEDDNKVLPGYNLLLRHPDLEDSYEFYHGAQSGLDTFHRYFESELKNGKNGQAAYNTAMQLSRIFINNFYRARQLPGDEIPF